MNDEACRDRPGILVVDDDADMAGELAELLESHGYEAWTANCLRDAIACIASRAPKFVLIDAGLGAESGVQLAAWLLDAAGPRPRVIMLSGRSPDPGDLRALGAGDVPWLMKPVDMKRLLDEIPAPDLAMRA